MLIIVILLQGLPIHQMKAIKNILVTSWQIVLLLDCQAKCNNYYSQTVLSSQNTFNNACPD